MAVVHPLRLILFVISCWAELYDVRLSVHLVQLVSSNDGHSMEQVFHCQLDRPTCLQRQPALFSWFIDGVRAEEHVDSVRLSNNRLVLIANNRSQISESPKVVVALQCMALLDRRVQLFSTPFYAASSLSQRSADIVVSQHASANLLHWKQRFCGRRRRSLSYAYVKPPWFVQRPDNTSVTVGSNVYLIATAKHVANTVWYLNGSQVVVDDVKMSLIGSGTLQINNVSYADQGLYTCVISNPLGQDSLDVWLKVEPPFEPTLRHDNPFHRSHDLTVLKEPNLMPKLHIRLDAPDVSRLSNTSVLLRWSMPPDDQLPSEPLLYKIQYKRLSSGANADWETVEENLKAESRNYVLGDLEPGAAYKFRYAVMLKNLQPVTSRTSKKTTLSRNQGSDVPDFAPELMTVVSKWPDAIEVKWEVNQDERAPIDGFIVQHRRVYSTLPMPFQNETIFGGETRSHMLDRLLPATPYEVRILAFNTGGASAPSESMVTSTRTLDGNEAAVNFFVNTEQSSTAVKTQYRPVTKADPTSDTQSLYTTAGIVFGIVAVVNVFIVTTYAFWKCYKRRGKRRRRRARSFHDISFKIFKESSRPFPRPTNAAASSQLRSLSMVEQPTVMKRSASTERCMAASLHCLSQVERQPLVVDDQPVPNNGRSAPNSCTL